MSLKLFNKKVLKLGRNKIIPCHNFKKTFLWNIALVQMYTNYIFIFLRKGGYMSWLNNFNPQTYLPALFMLEKRKVLWKCLTMKTTGKFLTIHCKCFDNKTTGTGNCRGLAGKICTIYGKSCKNCRVSPQFLQSL